MFLVLVVHASFKVNGRPDLFDFENRPFPSFTITAFESLSIVCVNVFVLISGWFGIKPSLRGFGNLIFQCLYFVLLSYVISIFAGWTTISIKELVKSILFTSLGYWFIPAYVGLYILSPALNFFIKSATQKQYKITLISFFVFQTIWGWSNIAPFICKGYSCFSFIGLYLLARYIRIYDKGKLTCWGGYFTSCQYG